MTPAKPSKLAHGVLRYSLLLMVAASVVACSQVDPSGVRTPPEPPTVATQSAFGGADVTRALAAADRLDSVVVRGSSSYDKSDEMLSSQSCEIVMARPMAGEFWFARDDNGMAGTTCEIDIEPGRGAHIGGHYYFIPGEGEVLDGKWRRYDSAAADPKLITGILTTLPGLRRLVAESGAPTSVDESGVTYSAPATKVIEYLFMGDGVLLTPMEEITEPVAVTVTLDERGRIASYFLSIPDPGYPGNTLMLRRDFSYSEVALTPPEDDLESEAGLEGVGSETVVFLMGARLDALPFAE